MKKRLLVGVLLMPLLASCATEGRNRRDLLVKENLRNAREHLKAGEKQEAAQIYRVVLLAAPDNAKARDKLQSLGGCGACIVEPTVLGQNVVNYPERESSTLWLAMYPLNRVLDVFDIITLEVGPQGGLYVDAHATYAVRTAAGAGGGATVGWSQKRELAVGSGHIAGLGLMPVSAEAAGVSRAGTRGARNVSFHEAGLNTPTDYIYQRHRDYWAVGGRAIAGLVGVRAEIHPVEIADALTGIFFVDVLQDDIGSTASLNLSDADRAAMRDLLNTLSPAEYQRRADDRLVPSGEQKESGP